MSRAVPSTSLAKLIFVRSITLSLLALIVFAFISANVLFSAINRSFDERLTSAQKLFSETILQDVLIGANSEIYKKCKAFLESQPVAQIHILDSRGQLVCDIGERKADGIVVETPIYYDETHREIAARILIQYSTAITSATKTKSLGLLLLTIAAIAVIQFLFARLISLSISNPVTRLSEKLATGRLDILETSDQATEKSRVTEVRMLIESTNVMAGKIRAFQAHLVSNATQEAMAKTAAQVAHDIRSPLAALDSVVGLLARIPEDDRLIIRSAVNRIKDIANNLIEKHREVGTASSGLAASNSGASREPGTVVLLSTLLDPLITEKRMQYGSRLGIEIDARLGTSSYGLFVNVQPTEFKRVLSNLVNNAVEALEEKGAVAVSLANDAGQVSVTVSDNGKGIATEILSRLGHKGQTHGKTGGTGLGLFHARTSVESWGGKIEIMSEIGKGTSVILSLPQADPPEWFVSELKLDPDSTVVALDDDSSIHGIWQGRFDSARVKEHGINVLHFSTPAELRDWVKANPVEARLARYLTDQELIGYTETGLSLIEELKIAPRSVLVTSRFEESQIREGCARLKVRLIPKGLAGFVPLRIVDRNEAEIYRAGKIAEGLAPSAILIDDDLLVHMVWKNSAKRAGMSVVCYAAPADFFAEVASLDRELPIYIDSYLGKDDAGRELKGEEISRGIKELGFSRIFLATGLPPRGVEKMSWLDGVRGKEPPFEEAEFAAIRHRTSVAVSGDEAISTVFPSGVLAVAIDDAGYARIRNYFHELLKPVQQSATFLQLLCRTDEDDTDFVELCRNLTDTAARVAKLRDVRIERRSEMSKAELQQVDEIDGRLLQSFDDIVPYATIGHEELSILRKSGELIKRAETMQLRSSCLTQKSTALLKGLLVERNESGMAFDRGRFRS